MYDGVRLYGLIKLSLFVNSKILYIHIYNWGKVRVILFLILSPPWNLPSKYFRYAITKQIMEYLWSVHANRHQYMTLREHWLGVLQAYGKCLINSISAGLVYVRNHWLSWSPLFVQIWTFFNVLRTLKISSQIYFSKCPTKWNHKQISKKHRGTWSALCWAWNIYNVNDRNHVYHFTSCSSLPGHHMAWCWTKKPKQSGRYLRKLWISATILWSIIHKYIFNVFRKIQAVEG